MDPKEEEVDVLTWLEDKPSRPNKRDFPDNVDADRIYERLFQGARPPKGDVIAGLGFDVLVLCAQEYQPSALDIPNVELIHMPSSDYDHTPPIQQHIQQVWKTADRVVERLREGKSVLVTCMMGFNRSGFVSGVALHLWLGWSGERCVEHIMAHRECALCNKRFAAYISHLPDISILPPSSSG